MTKRFVEFIVVRWSEGYAAKHIIEVWPINWPDGSMLHRFFIGHCPNFKWSVI